MSDIPNSAASEVTSASAGVDLDQFTNKGRPRVLIVDDEPDTVTLLKHLFVMHSFDVAGAASGKDALTKLAEINPSLVLLDIMMPEMDGWQTFENIRTLSNVPVIVVSAIGQSESIVKALQIGADDYITKPFDSAEVVARVNNVLRRVNKKSAINRLGFPDIQLILDMDTQEIFYQGKRIQLTGKMFEVLAMLARNAPHLVNYSELTTQIWNEKSPSARNRLKYLVYLLRQELNEVDNVHEIIKNVDRLGYKLLTTTNE